MLEGMSQLAALARDARAAVLGGDHRAIAECAKGSFQARRRMLALEPRHVEMIECARACEGGANYTGSGGAIVGVCRDERQRERALAALERIGVQTLVPTVGD